MSKVIKSVLGLFGVVSVAWWLGGMMYFITVAKHFRDKEKHEDLANNITSYLDGVAKSGARVLKDEDARILGAKRTKDRPISGDAEWHQGVIQRDSKWESFYSPTSRGGTIRHTPVED